MSKLNTIMFNNSEKYVQIKKEEDRLKINLNVMWMTSKNTIRNLKIRKVLVIKLS